MEQEKLTLGSLKVESFITSMTDGGFVNDDTAGACTRNSYCNPTQIDCTNIPACPDTQSLCVTDDLACNTDANCDDTKEGCLI